MLVKINNVSFSNGGTVIPDENFYIIFLTELVHLLFIHDMVQDLSEKKLPKGVTSVTGIVSQFQNTYQILVRDYKDFEIEEDKFSLK
jgi:hypothetical protein